MINHGGWKVLAALGIDGLGFVAPEAALAGMAINAAAMAVTAMSASRYDANDPQFTGIAPVTRGLSLSVSGYAQAAASPQVSLSDGAGFWSQNWSKFGKGPGALSAINDGISDVHDCSKCMSGN